MFGIRFDARCLSVSSFARCALTDLNRVSKPDFHAILTAIDVDVSVNQISPYTGP